MDNIEYLKAADYWNDKDKSGKKAPPEQILRAAEQIFTACKNCALATGHADYVRCTPVDYTYHDGAFWIFTEGGQKFLSLRSNKNVSLAIYDTAGTFDNLKSVQVMGTAELIEPFSDEYVRNAELRKIPIATLKKLTYPMYLLKITPSEIILLDTSFKQQGYDSREIWRAQ